MIRVYQILREQVVFEDFFISDEQGLSENIPLFVQDEVECYQIELRSSGYQAKKLQDILIFAHKNVYIEETLEGEASEPLMETVPVFPGKCLQMGDEGEGVRLLQHALHTLAIQYVQLSLRVNGYFDQATKTAIITFQQLFSLPAQGDIDEATWNLLFAMAEALKREQQPYRDLPSFQGIPLRIGMYGNDVFVVQQCLKTISQRYPAIPKLQDTFIFDESTQRALLAFQHMLGIAESGVVDERTWCLLQAMNREFQE